jgi:hypothetical protein
MASLNVFHHPMFEQTIPARSRDIIGIRAEPDHHVSRHRRYALVLHALRRHRNAGLLGAAKVAPFSTRDDRTI